MPKIREMWAYVIEDPDPGDPDSEGIPSILQMYGEDQVAMPLVGADAQRMADLADTAQHVADTQGRKVELRCFTMMRVMATFEPRMQSEDAGS